MTENNDVSATLPTMDHAAASSTPATPQMVPQEKVNEIARDAFNRGHQKGLSSQVGMGGMSPQTAPSIGLDQEHVNKMVGEAFKSNSAAYEKAAREEAQRKEGERILNELKTKVDTASKKYPDYEDVTKHHDWSQMPEVLHYANTVDNAGDVLYDLAKNPSKIATIRGLPPGSAALEIRKLSDSIKQNEQASKDAGNPPPSPSSQLKPSNLASDKKPSAASEYAAKYKGRG